MLSISFHTSWQTRGGARARRAGGGSSRSYVARANMISLDYANVRRDLVGAGRCFGE